MDAIRDPIPASEDPGEQVESETASANPPAVKLKLARAKGLRDRFEGWRDDTSARLADLDLAPDLAANIGSGRWFRGLGTMLGLGAVALAFWPDFTPLEAMPAVELDASMQAEFDSQSIAPLGLGATTGAKLAPAPTVIPLAAAPERPQINVVTTLTDGDSMASTGP